MLSYIKTIKSLLVWEEGNVGKLCWVFDLIILQNCTQAFIHLELQVQPVALAAVTLYALCAHILFMYLCCCYWGWISPGSESAGFWKTLRHICKFSCHCFEWFIKPVNARTLLLSPTRRTLQWGCVYRTVNKWIAKSKVKHRTGHLFILSRHPSSYWLFYYCKIRRYAQKHIY